MNPPPPHHHHHHQYYILEESNFDFRCVSLYDLDIPKENWFNYLQTV